MTAAATDRLLLALAVREVTYDLCSTTAEHAWLEGDVVHVATVERVGDELVRRQRRVSFDALAPSDFRIVEERVEVCAECRNAVIGNAAPGAEVCEDVRRREYLGGCEACCAQVERERSAA